ncbi:BppU family phage baseplate upper protein [Staphylococcus saprophyticus]|nr:BppU family phage baseplate upper protein [Staphylococcus saprophyticus]
MSMNKIKGIPLETTASYQALSQLGVQFWNQDRQTAILQFQITRNNYSLALSEENVKVFIALESGDSFLVDDNLDYVDELNGIVAYTIPTDFMRVAKNVVGQVYVTTLDEEEVVVQRKFSFDVANDLIASLPAEDKVREIKYFSDMRAEVAQMMEKLNNDFTNMNDYVTQVQQTTEDGIESLKVMIDLKEKAYNDNHIAKMKELNDKGTEYSNKFDSDKAYIDEKSQAFQEAVNSSGVVTTGQASGWQKYKLTNDDGTRKYLNKGSFTNVLDLAPGFYETVTSDNASAQGFPTGINNASFVEIDVFKAAAGRTQIKIVQNYNYKTFYKTIHTNGVDGGWKEITYANPDNPYETVQESQNKANTAEINAKTYTDEKYNSRTTTLFSGTANGVGTSIALSETLDNFIVVYVYGQTPGGYFVECADPEGATDFVFEKTNVIGADGSYATVFECIIQKVNRTQLKITSDTYHGIDSSNGSGPNANRFTITKIVGVRK